MQEGAGSLESAAPVAGLLGNKKDSAARARWKGDIDGLQRSLCSLTWGE